MMPLLPGPADADPGLEAEVQRARRRAEAEGIIDEVHAYCATRCPRRERCAGWDCRQYQREMAARDELLTSEDAP